MAKTLNKNEWLDSLFSDVCPADNYKAGLKWLNERRFKAVTKNSLIEKDGKTLRVFHNRKVKYKGSRKEIELNFSFEYQKDKKMWRLYLHIGEEWRTERGICGKFYPVFKKDVYSIENAVFQVRKEIEAALASAGENVVRVDEQKVEKGDFFKA